MLTIVEISECFPNKYKPVTGEFILQHVKALSSFCRVITLVPVRYVPGRELISKGTVKTFSEIGKWYSSLSKTENYTDGNLSVIYFGYVSLPRPYFESADVMLINFFFYSKLKNILKDLNPDIIYCNWLRPWSELSARLAEEFNIPFIIDHHEDIPTLKKLFPENYNNFLKQFERADRVIVHSSVNKKELEDEKLKINNISIVYLGQNFSADGKHKVFNLNNPKSVCVSHLYERRKNIDVLIKATALIKDKGIDNFSLTIAGDGNLRQEYEHLADSLRVRDIVNFTGSKSQTELGRILEEPDIFILPSFPEAFGVVLIEALAKGLPVITCEGNGGGEELKQLGYPAVLVKPHSPENLSEAVLELLKDKDRMTLMSEKGKQIVNKYFTWDKNAESSVSIIEETIKEFHSRK
ncbi:MAG TPA: glycosyltransferase family 4 protein [Ignavibacteria bacterium]|nr:glycosyltransferase family 4 protein [Ignavibacteria bacterium]